jgi:hypothetical protein
MAQPPNQDKETVPPKRPPIAPASPYADQVDATRRALESMKLNNVAQNAIDAANSIIDRTVRRK